jgi:RNA-directed DNA polymerase
VDFKYDLRLISNKNQLLKFLSIEEAAFDRLTQFKPLHVDLDHPSGTIRPINIPAFLRHDIPKKNPARGFRTVWEVLSSENDTYKAFSRRLDNFLRHAHAGYPHPSAYFDIKDFFPSIDRRRIIDLFKSTGVNDAVSSLLSDFLTIDGRLPLGLSPSPIIANAICLQLDRDFYDLSVSVGATYSRYADDITFSSNSILPTTETITAILETHSFEVAVEKTRRSKIGQSHFVTGLSVSDINQPHIPKAQKRRLRQELFFAKQFGLDEHFRHLGLEDDSAEQREVNRLDGMVKFTAFHEPRIAHRIKELWAKVLEDSGHKASFEPKNQHRNPFYMYFDESEYEKDDRKYLALGISVSQHQHKINNDTQEIWTDYLSDQWAAGRRDAIVRNGIHFTDATEDLKLKFVEKLQILPFQGYVAFSQYSEVEITNRRILTYC